MNSEPQTTDPNTETYQVFCLKRDIEQLQADVQYQKNLVADLAKQREQLQASIIHAKWVSAMETIEQLQARNKELEEWVILRCNELGDQIVKRDKTIEQLQADIQEMVKKAANNNLDGYREMGQKIAEQESTIEQLEAERQWISVEDRLPDKDGRYLIMIFNEHQPDQGSWIECEDWFGEWSRIYHATVTHWMPLPTPPEEKEDAADAAIRVFKDHYPKKEKGGV